MWKEVEIKEELFISSLVPSTLGLLIKPWSVTVLSHRRPL